MPFCFAPWSNLDISPQGIIGPCCKFRHGYYPDPPLNINEQGLDAYKNSRTLNIIKQDFQANQWPKGCERCRIEEENNVKSKRQLDYDRWQEQYNLYDIWQGNLLTASVAFGNTCNLTCITCGPHSSSRWQREHLQLYQKDISPNHFYKHGFVDDLLKMFTEIIHLDIPGGEPFLSGVRQQQELLEKLINQGSASRITLHYTTNVTVWPDKSWWDLWDHFREIDMQLSIDGVGAQFEYLRYPADWNDVAGNIQKYLSHQTLKPNLRVSVSHTASAYNIYYLSDFFNWCNIQGLPRPWIGRVHDPVYIRPSVWGGAAKRYIINKLQQGCDDAQTWAILLDNTDDSEHFDLFRQRLIMHDQYRGLNFAKTFPEMAQFL